MNTLKIAMMAGLMCSSSPAQNPSAQPADIDVEFLMEHSEDGKKTGSITHDRNTKKLAAAPFVNTFTDLKGRTSVVSISYVGYAGFQKAKNAKNEHLKPGYVFAVQVFSGTKDVTIETTKRNVTKLVVYSNSPQVLYKDDQVTVTIRNSDPSK